MTKATKKETSPEVSTAIVAQETAAVQVFDIQGLIAQAIEKNTPVETMERLLAIAKDMKAEWAKEQFTKAMAAFQAECPTIEKTKEIYTNDGKLAYKYAPLESIVEQVKEALQRNGFSYSTNMELLETGVKVFVKATHISGHSEVTEMNVPLGGKTKIMSDTQQVAAAQTFAKRYAFCNAFGILTGDEDTDASQVSQPQSYHSAQNATAPSEKQSALIADLKLKKGVTDEQLYADGFDVKNLTGGTASELIAYLLQFKTPGYGAPVLGISEGAQRLIQDLKECDNAVSYQKISKEAKLAKDNGKLKASEWAQIMAAAKETAERITVTKQQEKFEEVAAKINF
jgi:hypothetical protein